LSKIRENELYEELEAEIQNIYEYRENLCNIPLEEISFNSQAFMW
jgi:hypothetical protein